MIKTDSLLSVKTLFCLQKPAKVTPDCRLTEPSLQSLQQQNLPVPVAPVRTVQRSAAGNPKATQKLSWMTQALQRRRLCVSVRSQTCGRKTDGGWGPEGGGSPVLRGRKGRSKRTDCSNCSGGSDALQSGGDWLKEVLTGVSAANQRAEGDGELQ